MNAPIRIAILGYGNLGRGVELALRANPDMKFSAVFTRRDPATLKLLTDGVPVYGIDRLAEMHNEIDVLILCGGSAKDLPVQSGEYAKYFNIVDSFDNHSAIPEHFERCDRRAQEGGKTAVISVGWDPGMFSLQRLLGNCILPNGSDYTFWGRGVSQGHSDAIRRIDGVKNGKQYTVPVPAALEKVRSGENPELTTREKHTRECFVVAEDGADLQRIEQEIKTMPAYFAPYDTTVHFISQEEFDRDHGGMAHGGFVMRSGVTGVNGETRQMIEYSLKLGSNPEFTASVLVCCARAAYRMNAAGLTGAKTIFDIPPAYLSAKSGEELRRTLL
ncbi:MAG: diaminopimelate dehydrogenase [Ruminococcaceae bacterium]|nr:diaminopimelate dehydrogenase [Oscillospiraceae bacterium]